jgi:two-component system chemotaxis response regulator CheB
MKTAGLHLHFDIIAIGCSAGGIEALKAILPKIKKGFRPTVVVVQHIAPMTHMTLADFFKDYCELPVKEAEDKEPIAPGTIYFAPTGYHLLIENNRSFALSVESPVQFARPSIDVFMESVACVYKEAAAGFILTGSNRDGADGLKLIKTMGGFAGVQDPTTADFVQMPEAALETTETLFVLSISEIQNLIAGLE